MSDQTDVEVKALAECPEALAYANVVGAWVWITFPAKPSAETRAFLKARGHSWNPKREAWQHPCGVRRKAAPYDPRLKYGQVPASECSAEDLA